MSVSQGLRATIRFAKLVGASGVWKHAATPRVDRLWRALRAARRHGASPDRFIAVMAALRGEEVCVVEDPGGGADAGVATEASARGGEGARSWTWRALNDEIDRWTAALRAGGIAAGERVALALPNGATALIGQFAVARAGAIVMPLGLQLRAAEIAGVVAAAEPRLAIVEAGAHALWQEVCGHALPIWRPEQLVDSPPPAVATPRPRAHNASGGLLIFTSGTTGEAKAAHRAWDASGYASMIHMMQRLGARGDDRQLVVCPMYHSAAPAFAQMTLALGGQCVIMPSWSTGEVISAIERHQISGIFVVPTMLQRLVEAATLYPDFGHKVKRSLRWVLSGAAPLSPTLAAAAISALGPIVWNFYGATETGVVSLASSQELLARPGTVGRLLDGNRARLLVGHGEARRDAVGDEIGELYIKNGQLVAGYWANAAATAQSRYQEFVTVGDMARLDAEGYLYLEGRARDVIISGGVNLYPHEIEDRLAAHPRILEAAVVGEPDAAWGEAVVAVVVARRDTTLTAAEVIAWCREGLAPYKRPRRVVFVDALPRNAAGKVQKRALMLHPRQDASE